MQQGVQVTTAVSGGRLRNARRSMSRAAMLCDQDERSVDSSVMELKTEVSEMHPEPGPGQAVDDGLLSEATSDTG